MIDRCVGCPYRRSGLAGSSGPVDAPFVVVGEAPGANEARTGLPFVGDSGKLLDNALNKAGIDRADVYITNALRCRPTDSPPKESALKACQERLWTELAAAPRQVILALGNSAMRSVLDDFKLKVTSERGRYWSDPLGGVVATLHPASVLRNRGEYPKFVGDVAYAGSLVRGATPRSPGTCSVTLVTRANVWRVVDYLQRRGGVVAVDIETSTWTADDEYPAGVPGRILNFGLAYAKNKAFVFEGSLVGSEREVMRSLFADRRLSFVWHNGKFDTKWLRRAGIPARVDHDTMLMHYALDENKGGHGLEQLAMDYLGAEDWKQQMRARYPEARASFANIPIDVLNTYVAADADATLQLYNEFLPRVQKSKGLFKLYSKLLVPASEFLYGVESRGLWFDRSHFDQLQRTLEQQAFDALDSLDAVLEDIWSAELYQKQSGAKKKPKAFNPGSSQQVAWVLKRVYRRPFVDTKEPTLLALPPSPFVTALLSYRKALKMMGTFGEGIESRVAPDGRVHSTYFLHGTETGRLSSRDPNMQNIPAEPVIRNIFAAPPGRRLIELDYSQAELRLLAHFSDDDFLKQVYIEGRNLHDEVSKAMFGEGYSYAQKMRAKALNFGIAYGRGAQSLASEFHISNEEAEALRQAWFARMPKAEAFIKSCRAKVTTGRTMVTPFGRRRRFGMVTRENVVNLQNEAANFPMQSTVSDLTLWSAMKMQTEFGKAGLDAGVINLVHDSILIEADDLDVEPVKVIAERVMVDTPRRVLRSSVPFPVDIHVGQSWGEFK